jgi:hypothetical protein
VSRRYTLVQSRWRSMSQLTSCGHGDIGARVVCEKEIFEGWPRLLLKSQPLGYRDEHSRIRAAFRDDLRTFAKTRVKQLTESRLGVLDWPATTHGLSPVLVRYLVCSHNPRKGRWLNNRPFTFLLPAVTCVL